MNFEHELKTGTLSQLLPNLPEGVFTGSLALYIYGLVTEITPVIYNAHLYDPVDLNKEDYLGVPIDFEATPGGFRVGDQYFNSLKELECAYMTQGTGDWVTFNQFPIVHFKAFPKGTGSTVLMIAPNDWPYKASLFGKDYELVTPFKALMDAHTYEEIPEEFFMEIMHKLHTFVMPSFIRENLPF